MKKEDIMALFDQFEQAVCKIDETECWSARSLCELLGYTQWRNFNNVMLMTYFSPATLAIWWRRMGILVSLK